MGEFILQVNNEPAVILPNTCHKEGIHSLLHRCFGDGRNNIKFKLALSMHPVPYNHWRFPLRKQDGLYAEPIGAASEESDLEEMTSSEFGVEYDFIREKLCKYTRKDVTFTVSRISGQTIISTGSVTWTNHFPWATKGMPFGYGSLDRVSEYPWCKDQGYPWSRPQFWRGRLGAYAEGKGIITQVPDEPKLSIKGTIPISEENDITDQSQYVGMNCFITTDIGVSYSDFSVSKTKIVSCSDEEIIVRYGTGYGESVTFTEGAKCFFSIRPGDTHPDEDDLDRIEKPGLAYRAVTFPISSVLLIAEQNNPEGEAFTPVLVASAPTAWDIRLPPGGKITASYRGRLGDVF